MTETVEAPPATLSMTGGAQGPSVHRCNSEKVLFQPDTRRVTVAIRCRLERAVVPQRRYIYKGADHYHSYRNGSLLAIVGEPGDGHCVDAFRTTAELRRLLGSRRSTGQEDCLAIAKGALYSTGD